MSQEVWREFEDNALTHSAAHYLTTIHLLSIRTSMKLATFITHILSDKSEAIRFRESLRQQDPACLHDVKRCLTCQSVCLESEAAAESNAGGGTSHENPKEN